MNISPETMQYLQSLLTEVLNDLKEERRQVQDHLVDVKQEMDDYIDKTEKALRELFWLSRIK